MATLAGVFDRLLDAGATIIVIDHDLDLLAAADHLIDMGPGGGPDGGHILAAGTPEDVAEFLFPYIQAGCSAFNVIPCASDAESAIAAVASISPSCTG